MSSLDRTIEGDVILRHLAEDVRLIDQELLLRHGRASRTIVKEGPLRLTLIAIGRGGDFAAHRAPGQVTIHVLEGEIVCTASGREYPLKPGDVLALAAGVEHAARSTAGGVFLLTVVHEVPADSPGPS